MRSKLPYVGSLVTAQSHGPWQPLSSMLGGVVKAYDKLSGSAASPRAAKRQVKPRARSIERFFIGGAPAGFAPRPGSESTSRGYALPAVLYRLHRAGTFENGPLR